MMDTMSIRELLELSALASIPLITLWLYLYLIFSSKKGDSSVSKPELPTASSQIAAASALRINTSRSSSISSEKDVQVVQPQIITSNNFKKTVKYVHTPRSREHQTDDVDILIHNLSHGDMILDIATGSGSDAEGVHARPNFHYFRTVGNLIRDKLIAMEDRDELRARLVSVPLFEKNTSDSAYGQSLPCGFDISEANLEVSVNKLKFSSGRDGAGSERIKDTLPSSILVLVLVLVLALALALTLEVHRMFPPRVASRVFISPWSPP